MQDCSMFNILVAMRPSLMQPFGSSEVNLQIYAWTFLIYCTRFGFCHHNSYIEPDFVLGWLALMTQCSLIFIDNLSAGNILSPRYAPKRSTRSYDHMIGSHTVQYPRNRYIWCKVLTNRVLYPRCTRMDLKREKVQYPPISLILTLLPR